MINFNNCTDSVFFKFADWDHLSWPNENEAIKVDCYLIIEGFVQN